MARTYNVAVLVGSLRKDSINRKIANALIELAPPSLKPGFVEIAGLAVLFVTPEYNRSVPAPLKNAIDVGSRPYGQSAWNAKPGAVVSAAPGAIGGFGANHHLRQSLVFLNVPAMQQPEAYIGGADKLFGPDGKLTNATTREFLQKFMQAFADWVAANTKS